MPEIDYNVDPSLVPGKYETGEIRGCLRPTYESYLDAVGGMPDFYAAFPRAEGLGAGKLSLPYRAIVSFDSEWGGMEAQTTGDCVSHSTRCAASIDYGIDAQFGETEYRGRLATEHIYGARGHGGQGANCSTLANYISPDGEGGVLTRQAYEADGNKVDLSVYNSRIGHNWGRRGTPAWLNRIASKNKAMRVFRCKSTEQARDALAAGFGLSRCGWWGYGKRNADGVSDVRGRWSHAMGGEGVDDTDWAHQNYSGMLFLIQNSWGPDWISGGTRHEQPPGSFWIREKHFKAEIEAGGVFIVAAVRGWQPEAVYDLASKVEEISK